MFCAHDLATGDVLWQADLPTPANSVPMTYKVRPGGRQYVGVAAGERWGATNPLGDHLMAFAFPD